MPPRSRGHAAPALVVYREGSDGIHYRSRYGHSIHNWALFEPFMLTPVTTSPIDADDSELLTALAMHGVTLLADAAPQRV